MKKTGLFFLTLAAALFAFLPVSGQTGRASATKYGKGQDSIDCLMNNQLYRGNFRTKNYAAALPYWRKAFDACPNSSKFLVVDGATMYMKFLMEETNADKKAAYMDTLLTIYKTRMEFYPQDELRVSQYIGMDLYRHHPRRDDPRIRMQIRNNLDRYLREQGPNAEPDEIWAYFSTLIEQFKTGEVQADEVFSTYDRVRMWVDRKMAMQPDHADLPTLKAQINSLFVASGVADCANIIRIFEPQFAANPEDVDLLKRIQTLLIKNNCIEGDPAAAALFEKVTEKLIQKEPSAQASYGMAKLMLRKENYAKAVEYLQIAIDTDTVADNKADYYYQMALIQQNQLSKPLEALKYARLAISARENWGDPYLLVGTIYAQGAKSMFGGDSAEANFKRRTVYWAAVDKFMKAKSVDSNCADKANELIGIYSKQFPSSEDGFFFSVKEGDSYTVGGWINETTRVRY